MQDQGKLISASEVAEIWNKRAAAQGYKTNYTRFSVRQRHRKSKAGNELVPAMQTPLGFLYRESDAWSIKLQFQKSRMKNEFSKKIQKLPENA